MSMIYNSFKNNAETISENQYTNIFSMNIDNKEYRIILTKKRANKYSIIHCEGNTILWEQFPRFPRLDGRMHGEKVPIIQISPNKEYVTLFVVRGRPNGICGLDDGIFRSILKYDEKFVNVLSMGDFKKM